MTVVRREPVSADVAALPLSGRRILVTRPAEQARALAEAIRADGGTAVMFPVLEIRDIDDTAPIERIAERLDEFALAFFVSPNAVDKALSVILSRRAWPRNVRPATVGRSSERAIERFGLSGIVAPRERFDSEAVLELPEFQPDAVRGRRVVIFRGDGGRDLLGDTLARRGAQVEYVTCYRRAKPERDPGDLLALWQGEGLDAVTVTSSEGLRNLWDMIGTAGQARLRRTPVFVPHERIAEQARALGLERVVLTAAGDDGLIAGLRARLGEAKDPNCDERA